MESIFAAVGFWELLSLPLQRRRARDGGRVGAVHLGDVCLHICELLLEGGDPLLVTAELILCLLYTSPSPRDS